MGAYERRKGHNFERWVAAAFRCIFPDARRHLEYHPADATGIDIGQVGPFRIQCKKCKAYAPITKIQEVQCDKEFGDVPLLVTAGDNLPPVAVLYFDDFLSILRELKERGGFRNG